MMRRLAVPALKAFSRASVFSFEFTKALTANVVDIDITITKLKINSVKTSFAILELADNLSTCFTTSLLSLNICGSSIGELSQLLSDSKAHKICFIDFCVK